MSSSDADLVRRAADQPGGRGGLAPDDRPRAVPLDLLQEVGDGGGLGHGRNPTAGAPTPGRASQVDARLGAVPLGAGPPTGSRSRRPPESAPHVPPLVSRRRRASGPRWRQGRARLARSAAARVAVVPAGLGLDGVDRRTVLLDVEPARFIPSFFLSFDDAKLWTKLVVVVTLPWLRLPRVPWPWLLFLGLCYLSQLWSISDPNTDLSNLVYMQVALMAFVVAANCEALVVCWGLGLGGVVVVALSEYAYRQGLPGTSNAAIGGAEFTGVGTNENILAYTLVLSLAALLAIELPRRRAVRLAWATMLACSAYGIYLAQSGGGILAALGVLLTAVVVANWRSLRRRRRHALGALALGRWSAPRRPCDRHEGFGKGCWDGIRACSLRRATVEASLETAPWLGSGWGAVWEHPWNSAQPNSVAELIYAKAGYTLPHGHNLFLDVLPEVGLVGLTIAVIMVGYSVLAARRSGLRTGVDPTAGLDSSCS